MSGNPKTPITTEGSVLGIAGPSGSGKTTLIKALSECLPNTVCVHFDEYEAHTEGPESLDRWLAEGADYNAWSSTHLESDVTTLKGGGQIEHPVSGTMLGPASRILFDAPMGYANQQLGTLIDIAIYLDVPLDIAMARRLLRDTDGPERTDLATEMQNYLAYGRACYLAMIEKVKPGCDVIVDASYPVDTVVSEIMSHLAEWSAE